MAPRNDNRDWLTRPDQGFGRSSHDYGHTYLEPEHESYIMIWVMGALVIGLAAVAWVLL